MTRAQATDVHQHLWPEAVLRVLERRNAAPRARWQDRRWLLELAGEPAFEIDPSDHDPETRAGSVTVDKALVALSGPVGIEALPLRDALAAIADAYRYVQTGQKAGVVVIDIVTEGPPFETE